jgi:hypothetical protein
MAYSGDLTRLSDTMSLCGLFTESVSHAADFSSAVIGYASNAGTMEIR